MFTTGVALLIAAGIVTPPAPGYVPSYGSESAYFPSTAFYVPVSQKANIQTLLNTYGEIRLDSGIYTGGGAPASITVGMNQKIYGLMEDTQTPPIIITPGTSGAIVKGVICGSLTFPTSALVTSNNVFSGIAFSDINASNTKLEQNLFLSLFAGVHFNTSGSGWLRNNRFIRVHSQGAGYGDGLPAFQLIGDAARQSYGNVVVAFNALGAQRAGLYVTGQAYCSAIGYDDESYYGDHGDGVATIYVRNTGLFNVIGFGGAPNTDHIDSGADKSNMILNDASTAGVVNGVTVQNVFRKLILNSTGGSVSWWKSGDVHNTPNALTNNDATGNRFYEDSSFNLYYNGTQSTNNGVLSGAGLTAGQNFFASDIAGTYVPWGKYNERAIPDPGGPSWNVNLASKPDETPALQALLNANRVVKLEARAYYLGTTLLMNPGQVIIGAGKNQTVLIAKSTSLNMIQTNFNAGPAFTGGVQLIDFTMQGGNTGYRQAESGAQLNGFVFAHLCFRDMTTAGIELNNTYAWDNGWLEYVDFYTCASGIKQRGTGTGIEETISYIDKANFFRCQWIQCGIGIDFLAGRPNNLDSWTECLWKNCSGSAVSLVGAHNYPTFTNCKFVNNGGTVQVNANLSYNILVGCDFVGSAANSFLVSQQSLCEGCTFTRGGGSANLINTTVASGTEGFLVNAGFWNCVSTDVPVGNVNNPTGTNVSLVTVNCSFPAASAVWQAPVSALQHRTNGSPFLGDDSNTTNFGWVSGSVNATPRFARDRT